MVGRSPQGDSEDTAPAGCTQEVDDMQNLCLVPTLRPHRETVALLPRPNAAEESYESEMAYRRVDERLLVPRMLDVAPPLGRQLTH
jgi:hypothetical protein